MSNGKQPKVQKDARDYRRFIEESFPVKEVGEASVHERSRSGHINTLHIWWARRPLAASRATAYAALDLRAQRRRRMAEEARFHHPVEPVGELEQPEPAGTRPPRDFGSQRRRAAQGN